MSTYPNAGSSSSSPGAPGIDMGWSPEPELRENPPRRFAPSEYPDYNKPNAGVFVGVGGALLLLGLIAFFTGLLGGRALFTILGIVLAVSGGALVAYFPSKVKAYRDRSEHLVTNGVPVMARIVNVQNLTGDSQYGRHVTYMITLPGDNEETRRETKADDRALPKKIPGPVTAVMDFQSRECELYCVLPYRAVAKFAPAGGAAAAPVEDPLATIPVQQAPAKGGGMGTIGGQSSPPPQQPAVSPGQMGSIGAGSVPAQPTGQKPSGADKLPWEQ